jgi:hypothetical protein
MNLPSTYSSSLSEGLEFYGLFDCDSKELCTVNGFPTVFVYDGTFNKDLDPEKIVGKKMKSFTTINEKKTEGCFKIELIECADNYEILNYSEFFLDAEFQLTVDQVKVFPTVPFGRTIYPEAMLPNNVDSGKALKIMTSFSIAMQQKYLQTILGIKMCCGEDHLKARLKHQILKLDLIDGSKMCCP